MTAFKDKERGTWFCKFYYTEYTGEKKQKKKRGFATKKEALEWERNFLTKEKEGATMFFKDFAAVYLADFAARYKESALETKKHILRTKLLPYFGKRRICDITASDIRKWQNNLMGKGFSPTYLRLINSQLSAIFNFAVKYYGLRDNPCKRAGSMGKSNADEMLFWTRDEFMTFIEGARSNPDHYMIFQTLYWTGLREGELLALTPADIDFENRSISVTKSYQRLNRKDIVSTPKTAKSKRSVSIPDFLCSELKEYVQDMRLDQRIFPYIKNDLRNFLRKICSVTGVKVIRIHDIRHSHASLLIELGLSPKIIADRLGHKKIETTLNIYSHLYPNKQEEVADKLQALF